MKNLFLSYNTLVRQLATGWVKEEDLDEAVFYFYNFSRETVFDHHSTALLRYFRDSDSRASAHRLIVRKIQEAEADGRAAFRELGQRKSYAVLEAMLDRIGVSIRGWDDVTSENSVDNEDVVGLACHFGLKIKINGMDDPHRTLRAIQEWKKMCLK